MPTGRGGALPIWECGGGRLNYLDKQSGAPPHMGV
jgi:hypothetical protein